MSKDLTKRFICRSCRNQFRKGGNCPICGQIDGLIDREIDSRMTSGKVGERASMQAAKGRISTISEDSTKVSNGKKETKPGSKSVARRTRIQAAALKVEKEKKQAKDGKTK